MTAVQTKGLKHPEARTLLNTWYHKDENLTPPVFLLNVRLHARLMAAQRRQPIAAKLPGVLIPEDSDENKKRHRSDRDRWFDESAKMALALHAASGSLSPDRAILYKSVLEQGSPRFVALICSCAGQS